MASIICPVAKCLYTVRSADDGWKHWQDYDAFHKQLHRNWLNSFFPDIAGSDENDVIKFRKAYKEWKQRENSLNRQRKKRNEEEAMNKIEVKNGKYFVDGKETEKEELKNIGINLK